MAERPDSFELVETVEGLEALRPDWERLLALNPAHVQAQTPDWCLAAWRHVAAPRGARLATVVGRRDGAVDLIWPLVAQRRMLWPVLRPLDAQAADYCDLSLDSWRRLMSINLDGVFLGMKHVIPSMKSRAHMWPGGGSIISISSIMGFIGGARAVAYCASKGGVRLMTKAAAIELAPAKIRVNSVHPGFINTPLLRAGEQAMNQRQEGGFQKFVDDVVSRHPLGRLGEEQDIAHAVRFLASDDSAFMTGTEVVVDGGYLAQ